jgi:hypothetical protein
MAARTLRTQILACCVVLVAMAQPGRAQSFQITGVTPAAAYSCPSASGCTTTVTVQGQGFNNLLLCAFTCPAPYVMFGDKFVFLTDTDITDTQITVILPVHSPGTVDVTVAAPFGYPSSTLPAGFTFLDPAAIPLLDGRTATLLALSLALIGWSMSARLR